MPQAAVSRQLLMATLLIALILAVAGVLIDTVTMLLLLFAGIVFGIFLNAISQWLTSVTRLPYRWSYLLVVVLLLLLVVAGIYYLGWQIADQANEFSAKLRESTKAASQRLQQYDWAQQYLPEASQLQNRVTDGVLSRVLQGMQSVAGIITGLLVILFVGLYTAFDPELYSSGIVKLIPPDRRRRAHEVLQKLNTALARWVTGRLISMAIIGILTTVSLSLLNVPLPISLGIIAGLLTFIPNIGPIVATIPQALLALEVDLNTVLYVILLNIALQTFESYLITPIIQRYTVTLPPVVTIFAQLVMGVVVGVIGIIMAAPLATSIMVVLQMLYIHDRLGDPEPGGLV